MMDACGMNESKKQPATRGLMGYEASLEAEIFAFQKVAYPERRQDWIAPRWRWMFLSSAQRLGVPPMVWFYRNASGIVAHQGAIPVRLKVGAEEHITGWFVETMALASVRGKAIGPMLIKKALEELPFNLSLGQTPQMRTIQVAMGWQQVAPLGTYALVLNPRRVLEAKLHPRWLQHPAALGYVALQRSKHFLGQRRLQWTPTVAEIARFDATHDRLWDEVKHAYQCIVVRDASYLNWKYVEQPGQDFLRLEVKSNTTVVAIAVVCIVEPGPVYPYRRGFLVDLVVPATNQDVIWAALEAVRQACEQRHVDLLTFYLISRALQGPVTSFGFFARAPTRFFLVTTGGISPETTRLVRSPAHWFITQGDSDIDRPW
jgi:hypothetical protein